MSKASSPFEFSDNHRTKRDGLFLPKVLLAIILALPLGIITGIAGAIPTFGSIIPVSVLLGLICPIIVPVVVIAGILLGGWRLTCATIRLLIRLGTSLIALATHLADDTRLSRALHILFHAHEIAYMGIYGLVVCFRMKPLALSHGSETHKVRVHPARARLFISNLPLYNPPIFPLTPPSSNPSHTPTCSPTLTENTDPSSIQTPIDDPTYSSIIWLSDKLGLLRDEELDLVANYVDILRKGREDITEERISLDGRFDF